MSNIGFPIYSLQGVDPKTGAWNREWYLFFQELWTRTGGASGTSTTELVSALPEDAGIEEIRAGLNDTRDAALQVPPSVIPDVESIVMGMLPGPINKADIGLGSVENTALSAWSGSTSLTTLGTISTGTWQASVVQPTYGGTGVTSLGALTADPSASVGLTAVNGAASTFMRSDGAPALSQAIAPTWTGDHAWSNAKITPDQLKGIVGTTTNNSATAGSVGEYMSASSTVSSTGTGKYFDIASLNLTAGDWDVSCVLQFSSAGATWSRATAGIGTVAGDNGTGLVSGDTQVDEIFTSSSATPTAVALSIPAARKSLSGATTIYLKGYSVFSAGTPSATGRISARRVR